MDKEMYDKNWTHPWNVRGAMNCATTNGQFVKGYVILYKWYYLAQLVTHTKFLFCMYGYAKISLTTRAFSSTPVNR